MGKHYQNLTQEEVNEGEVLALRTALSIIVFGMMQGHPNPEAAYTEMMSAVTQIAHDIPLTKFDNKVRETEFRELVADRACDVFRNAQNIGKGPGTKPS